MPNETTTTEPATDTTEKQRNSFPVGDATASVRFKGGREPTADDLRHAALACEELAAQIRNKLAGLDPR